ncbi:hypothetical protein KI387_014690, partial [Taxus chinensis]
RWSVSKRWESWRGSSDPHEESDQKPIISLSKSSRFSNKNKTRCNVFVNRSRHTKQNYDYHIEGSLCKPPCTIFSASGHIIAQ